MRKVFTEYRYEESNGKEVPGFMLKVSNSDSDGEAQKVIQDGCYYCEVSGGKMTCTPVPCLPKAGHAYEMRTSQRELP